MPNRAVIMVAGGTGTRMQSSLPKQFIPLDGKPVILHSFDAFKAYDPEMQFILVLFKGLEQAWQEILDTHQYDLKHTLVEGGEERFHSVKNGLDALGDDVDVVAIHDAVRPLVSQETITRCFEGATANGSAIPTIPVVDTVRRTTPEGNFSIPRHELEAVQTPQCFKANLIKEAYNTAYRESFTDDASVLESTGREIHRVSGNRTNIKITTQEDLLIAKAFLDLR